MTKIDFRSISDNLELDDDIWVTKSKSNVSYPEQGHEFCFKMEENSFWFRHRNNCIIEVVKLFPLGGIFFDIGGGNGFVSKGLEEKGIETVLLEPGEKGVANAKKKGLKNIICSTLENTGFKYNTLPAVGLFDVIEHIEDDERFLKSVFHLLKPRGRLYITVPAFNFLWSEEDEYAGHFRRYTIKSLRKMLVEIGFHVEYATYIFSILSFPIFLFRSLPHKLGFIKKPNWESRHKSEHSRRKGISGKLLEKIWNTELKRIKNKKKIPFGGSCLIVSHKRDGWVK
ncbi:MAG: methyltransferase domain-containing protein [Candidatus Aminicenantes bacterium]|nr:methyltransferase domain-containing protein [Candidatus Aminicenantes bacterium]NIM77594.1 methyltransferase domain-containing protein [Candidatus Aminicenantes bacterium]NIN16908.1 methyltransferase domain-containing protein [Candidatus Aminicenantes bacterium]NIN40801.1 methyltransferase domain-containing protein [Candidatus Aminicenantes bacterium]NIN83605.1 methyltransferase domain-containing protein [Candidatus Aminicenantes bacterium]